MSSAFPFPRPITAEDKSSQYEQLRSWSKAASRTKTLAGHALKINVLCTEYQPPSTLPPPPIWNGRQLSHRQVPARFLDPDVDTIYLVKPLLVGNGWTSQVWAASFDPASLDDDATLAVKIYQSSWHPCVKSGTLKINNHPLLYDKFFEYQCEASAYNAYAPLQGSVVPYVRGFYQIELPHGEPAVAMVMERIRKRKVSRADFSTIEQAAKGLLDAAFDLYRCGMVTMDFGTNSVLWPINLQTNEIEGYPC